MAADLLNFWSAWRADSNLRKRVESALILAANDIRNEGAGAPNHAARLAWAEGILFDTAKLAPAVERGTLACLLDGGIATDPDLATDAAIRNVVNGVAGVMALQPGA